MKKIRILLAGGGTGGHIFPLCAVAEKIRDREPSLGATVELRYFGSPGVYRNELESLDIKISHVAAPKWRRYFSILNFFDIFKGIWGIIEAAFKIYWYMPDVIFSKGGPGALIVALVGKFYAIPIIIHESDTVPGLTNLKCGKLAKIIELAFPESAQFFGKEIGKTKVVGMPIRKKILEAETEKARLMIDISEEGLPLLLIVGGSQGAEKINGFILDNLQIFLDHFRIIHQIGTQNYPEFMKEYEFVSKEWSVEKKKRYRPMAFLGNELREAMAASNVIVSRAGATFIFEIACMGKPSILIPLENSASDHQRQNAYAYAKNGAALVIEEENLLIGLFTSHLEDILENKEKMNSMSEAAKRFCTPEAGERIVEDILTLASIA